MRAKLLPIALLLLAACGGGAAGSGPLLDSGSGEILVPTRLEGMPSHHSGIATERRLVIRTRAELEAFWAELSHPNSFGPVPAVDFHSEMLIVAAMGTRPSGGYRVSVESVASTGSGYNVVVKSVSPARECPTLAVITQPIDILRVPVAREVRFVEQAEVHRCG
ncbi:MAG TPA: protease complex subunit PrcB family protein [Longimicrobium sp.]|nr:protease complex subunit PrcB family protein [Longimicrobium sp.]